jgi:GT2 family glycosyltransferase
LVDTVQAVLALRQPPQELILVDQTETHAEDARRTLTQLHSGGLVRWLRLPVPSIPRSMNVGLSEAHNENVLFLDDDIVPGNGLLSAHLAAHQAHLDAWAVVGQVLQPGEEPASRKGYVATTGVRADLDFPFWSDTHACVSNVMAGNLSVKRERALACGGFDENFQGVAYRFETEFARRLIAAGGRIRFEPKASIRHLRAARGGTRSQGSHLTSASPIHGMGDYYFALRQGCCGETVTYMARRTIREVCTRFHLRHPWYIPVKLLGEMRALLWAVRLWRRGPKLVRRSWEQGAERSDGAGE